jgi:hypothetical protein
MGWVNQERWDIWVRGLVNERDIEDEETKALVDRALKEVGKVEDQGWRIVEDEKYA